MNCSKLGQSDADAARELLCCLGLLMYILYMFIYIVYILRIELLLSKADFSKTKKMPKQRDKSRFLHGESKFTLLSTFGTSNIAAVGQKDLCYFLAMSKDCT